MTSLPDTDCSNNVFVCMLCRQAAVDRPPGVQPQLGDGPDVLGEHGAGAAAHGQTEGHGPRRRASLAAAADLAPDVRSVSGVLCQRTFCLLNIEYPKRQQRPAGRPLRSCLVFPIPGKLLFASAGN